MDLESVKNFLEKTSYVSSSSSSSSTTNDINSRLFESMTTSDLKVDLIEPGRVICSMIIPPTLLNVGSNSLHGGATATLVDLVGSSVLLTNDSALSVGVSVEINVSYMDSAYLGDEIEIEAKALNVGKATAVVSVEFRKKKTGKIIAQGRHTKYLAVSSKL